MNTRRTRGTPPDSVSAGADPVPAAQALPMHVFTTTLTTESRDKEEIRDLTDQLDSLPAVQQTSRGFVLIHSLHTTVGLCVNEFENALLHDIETVLRRIVPTGHAYRHDDPADSGDTRKNTTSHLRAILLGQTLHIPIEQGRLKLGTWQRVLFCEFDGPQTRQVFVQVMGV